MVQKLVVAVERSGLKFRGRMRRPSASAGRRERRMSNAPHVRRKNSLKPSPRLAAQRVSHGRPVESDEMAEFDVRKETRLAVVVDRADGDFQAAGKLGAVNEAIGIGQRLICLRFIRCRRCFFHRLQFNSPCVLGSKGDY